MDFQFIRQGTRYGVHTQVGDGPARVLVRAEVPEDVRQEAAAERRAEQRYCPVCRFVGSHAQRCPESYE